LNLSIGPTIGRAVISGFALDANGVVDLTGGLGGFRDTTMVLFALKSDGRGGTLLSFGKVTFLISWVSCQSNCMPRISTSVEKRDEKRQGADQRR
jgi:hypothetical protein